MLASYGPSIRVDENIGAEMLAKVATYMSGHLQNQRYILYDRNILRLSRYSLVHSRNSVHAARRFTAGSLRSPDRAAANSPYFMK
jgi:hypothetical protein